MPWWRCLHGLVQTRSAAAGRRPVHHVVLHQRERVEQFQARGRAQRRERIGPPGEPAEVGERRTQLLAALDEIDCEFDQFGRVRRCGPQFPFPFGEKRDDRPMHLLAERVVDAHGAKPLSRARGRDVRHATLPRWYGADSNCTIGPVQERLNSARPRPERTAPFH